MRISRRRKEDRVLGGVSNAGDGMNMVEKGLIYFVFQRLWAFFTFA